MEEEQIRIVFVGDKGVGKTSLITTAVSSSFQEKVAPTIGAILIPSKEADELKYRTELIDTSSRENDQHRVEEQIKTAHFVCVVYDVNVPETKQSALNYWIPKVRRLNDKIPYGLIGTKTDIRDANSATRDPKDLETAEHAKEMETEATMREQTYLEFVFECSAKRDTMVDLDVLFWYAQQGVLYPRAALYDYDLKFTPEYTNVLQRIFRLIDSDKDGYLDDKDIRTFQQICFDQTLDDATIDSIKDVVRQHDANCVASRGVTLRGFMIFFHLLIDRGRREPIWAILRHFGYDNQLNLNLKHICPDIKVPPGSVVELSRSGINFLHHTFLVYQQRQSRAPRKARKSGILTRYKLNQLFSLVPEGGQHPWKIFDFPDCCAVESSVPNLEQDSDEDDNDGNDILSVASSNTTVTSGSDSKDIMEERLTETKYEAITVDSFLAMWAMTTMYDYKCAMKYLAYLGYDQFKITNALSGGNTSTGDNNVVSAFTITRQRDRTVFLGYVLGTSGSGKHALVQTLAGKNVKTNTTTNKTFSKSRFGVGKLKNSSHLVLEVIDDIYQLSPLSANSTLAANPSVPSATSQSLSQPTKTNVPSSSSSEKTSTVIDVAKLKKADVILLLYDQSQQASFRYAMRAFLDIEKICPNTPCLFVANKSDLPSFTKSLPPATKGKKPVVTPQDFCKQHSLPQPISISITSNTLNNVFDEAVEAVKNNIGQRRMSRKKRERNLGTVIRIAAVSVLVVGVWVAFRSVSRGGAQGALFADLKWIGNLFGNLVGKLLQGVQYPVKTVGKLLK